jgi:hypothetical protein
VRISYKSPSKTLTIPSTTLCNCRCLCRRSSACDTSKDRGYFYYYFPGGRDRLTPSFTVQCVTHISVCVCLDYTWSYILYSNELLH